MDDWGERDARWAGVRTEVVEVHGTPVRLLRRDGDGDGDRGGDGDGGGGGGGGGGGMPQLLVHGLGGSAANWLEVLGELSAHGPVAACDLPGFGETPPPQRGSVRVRANAGFVAALCRVLGWDRVVLYGNSMGGTVATLVAGQRPDLVGALVLVSPALPAARRDLGRALPRGALRVAPYALPVPGRARLLRALHRRLGPEAMYDRTLDVVFSDADRMRAPMREVAVGNLARAGELSWRIPSFVRAAESLTHLIAAARPLRAAVAAVEAPTLVVWGEHDRLIARAVVDDLRRRRPDWEFATVAGVGHAAQMEAPDRFLDEVGPWLATLSGGGRLPLSR